MGLRHNALAAALLATLFVGGESLGHAEKPKADFGVGISGRQLQLTRGFAEVFTEAAPPGTRTDGVSIEFARRGKELEFVLGFGYDNLEATDGYYLQSAGDPLVPGHVDYTDFSGFHWYTIDATLVGYLKLHKVLAIRYGAGLGIGIVRGEVTRTDQICSSDNIRQHCVPDPDGAQQQEVVDLPAALPIIHAHAGLQFRPIKSVAINLDAGIRTVPYLGVSAMFYLW